MSWTVHRQFQIDAQPLVNQPDTLGVLEIETTRVNWPYFDDNGTPQSEDVRMRESFVLSEDGERLDYGITVTDPGVFTRPVVADVSYAALGEPLHDYRYCPGAE